MEGKKPVTSIEEVLAASGLDRKSPNQRDAKPTRDGSAKSSFSSVEDVIAAAEEARKKEKKNYKTFASTLRSQTKENSRPADSAPSDHTDLMDDFDHAIEAAMVAKKSVPNNQSAAQTMAVSLLLKKKIMSRSVAEELVPRAFKYLEK